MTDADPADPAAHFPRTPGVRLREAREAQGISLDEIAARTRVPVRQLEAIERGDYSTLPSMTYSVGFAKAYARAVGIDEVTIAHDVRSQNTAQPAVRRTEYIAYEPTETRREPTGLVAVIGVVVALLVVVAAGLWYGTTWFRGDASAPASVATTAVDATVPTAPATPAVAQGGQVVLTANDDVWLRIYDPSGDTIYESTLNPGATYAVPQDIAGLMINVGRPDKLKVTINGSEVPALGDGKVAIKDVPISAAALLARGKPAAATTPSAAPTTAVTSATGKPAMHSATKPSTKHRTESDAPPSGEPNSATPLNIAAPSASSPAPAAAATPAP